MKNPQKTTLRQNVANTDRQWYIVDADGQTLGRLATVIADTLRGKRRVDYTPHTDNGDYVVVLNAEKIRVSGQKETNKLYRSHSGYLGHLKETALSVVRAKQPSRILESAVSGMLAKNRHRKDQMRRLFLVKGDKNPYTAQKPQPLNLQ